MAPDLTILLASAPEAPVLDDEAFCRIALRDAVPPLALTLDELLRRFASEKAAA